MFITTGNDETSRVSGVLYWYALDERDESVWEGKIGRNRWETKKNDEVH